MPGLIKMKINLEQQWMLRGTFKSIPTTVSDYQQGILIHLVIYKRRRT